MKGMTGLGSRKGQGMSINTVVVAALALIILVILALILTGRITLFNKGLNNCNGRCISPGDSCNSANEAPVPTSTCIDSRGSSIPDGTCCLPAS